MTFQDLLDERKKEGIQEGIQKGIQQGIQQGIQEGEAMATLKMIRSFLAQGFPLEAIAKASGMSLEYIQGLNL